MKQIIFNIISLVVFQTSFSQGQCVQPNVPCPCDTSTHEYFLLTAQQYSKLERYKSGVNVFFGAPTANGACIAVSVNAFEEFKDTLDKLNIKKGFINTYRLTRCSIGTFTCTTDGGTPSGSTEPAGKKKQTALRSGEKAAQALIALPLALFMGLAFKSESKVDSETHLPV